MKREKTAIEVGQVWRDKRDPWMPDHVADAILEEAGIDADKELQRAMDTVARYEFGHQIGRASAPVSGVFDLRTSLPLLRDAGAG